MDTHSMAQNKTRDTCKDNKHFKCRILGTATGKPVLGKNHASVWLSFSDNNILIDCGEGVSQQVLRYGLDIDLIDAVVISHYHPDHVCGLFLLIQLLYLQNRKKELNIYLPERIDDFKQIMNFFYLFPERMTFQLNFKPMHILADIYPQLIAIKNSHLSGYRDFIVKNKLDNEMMAYSYVLTVEDKSIIYTSDFIDGLSELISEVDYAIIDGMHPTADECLKIIAKTKVKAVINHGISAELQIKLKQLPPQQYDIAVDGYLLGD